MKLVYCYIGKFRNIVDQEVNFSDSLRVHYGDGRLSIGQTEPSADLDFLYGSSLMRDLHLIVGKTGSGKTNLLQLIGMDAVERYDTYDGCSYLFLYQMKRGMFMAEVVGLDVAGLQSDRAFADMAWVFNYDFDSGEIRGAQLFSGPRDDCTCIVNAFDRTAFTHCPYPDEKRETYRDEPNHFLTRLISPYGKSSASMECEYIKDYLSQFPPKSVKHKAAFEIVRDNWQNALEIELPDDLLENDYWTFATRANEQRLELLKKGRKTDAFRYPKGSTPKSRFLHDLMTDYAIYLRKWAECVDGYEDEVDYFISTMPELPDWKRMSILKRIEALSEYIDSRTDDYHGKHGLVWQISSDIKDIFYELKKLDDRYFSDDKFSIPVEEIDLTENYPMQILFERMDQYRPDDIGIFTKELLPYRWTCLSSGEYQYAKVWGVVEEYAVRVKMLQQGQSFKDTIHPNMIVLLDEPETYMHPEMCRCFISKMVGIIRRVNSDAQLQIILSTHSPFMLSDVLSSQVIKMDYDDMGLCRIYQDNDCPYFAANIHSIMADGFFLKYSIGEQARLFLQEKVDFLKQLCGRNAPLSEDERKEVNRIEAFLPQVGDELIRLGIQSLIDQVR